MSDFYKEDELEKAEIEADVKKRVKEKKKGSKLSIAIAGMSIALIFAIIAFWLMLSAEEAMLNKYEKTTVYIVNTDIVKGTKITDPSVFSKMEVDKNSVPSGALNGISTLENTYAAFDINANTIITNGMFYSVNDAEKGNREISFAVAGLSGSVNGTVRASDYIDIYIVNPVENKEDEDDNKDSNVAAATPAYTHVYVSEAYTEDGIKISNTDKTSIAARFTIVVPEKEADNIINAFISSDIGFYITKWTDEAVMEYEKAESGNASETDKVETEDKAETDTKNESEVENDTQDAEDATENNKDGETATEAENDSSAASDR